MVVSGSVSTQNFSQDRARSDGDSTSQAFSVSSAPRGFPPQDLGTEACGRHRRREIGLEPVVLNIGRRKLLWAPRHPNLVDAELLLEDAVRDWLQGHPSGTLAILGGDGSGKTTAMAHLRARLADEPDVLFLDEPTSADLRQPSQRTRVVFVRERADRCDELRLTPWSRDDCLEYLLARLAASSAFVEEAARA